MTTVKSLLARSAGKAAVGCARLVTGVHADWRGCKPAAEPRVYFANHTSHGDFVLIWSVLPAAQRAATSPVAAADYWEASPVRRWLGHEVFDAVLIERGVVHRDETHPVTRMSAVLDAGRSLIVFPEGTRNTGSDRLLPLKSGLYHLAKTRPEVDLVPVWIENLNRVMPKGSFVPVPLLCTVTFGEPLRIAADEDRTRFLGRARDALLALGEREAKR